MTATPASRPTASGPGRLLQPAGPRRAGSRTGARAVTLGAALAAVVLAACSGSATTGPSATPTGSASPSVSPTTTPTASNPPAGPGVVTGDLVLRVDMTGGFIGPGASLTAYPTVAVYTDGSVIQLGPVDAIYPGPLMPNLQVTHLAPADLATVIADAKAAGLDGPSASYDLATPVGADMGITVFTFVDAAGKHTISANALQAPDNSTADPATTGARHKLSTFLTQIGTFAPGNGANSQPYHYTGIRIYATAGAQPDPSAGKPVAWPLATRLASFGTEGNGTLAGSRCGTVDGADLETLRPILANATQLTTWSSGSDSWSLVVRVLLPEEKVSCPAS